MKVRVWSDFVCPWCYVGLAEVEKLKQRYDLEVDWRPFFLRPETPPEGLLLPESIRERMKDPNNPLKRRAAAAGLKMIERERIPSTRRAHEAAEYARAHGQLAPLHASSLRRYWSEGQDLFAWETLRGAAQDAGLDPDDLQRAIEAGQYRERVQEAVDEAHALGIHAVPTFLFADQLVIQGAQEYPAFEEAMRRLGASPRAP